MCRQGWFVLFSRKREIGRCNGWAGREKAQAGREVIPRSGEGKKAGTMWHLHICNDPRTTDKPQFPQKRTRMKTRVGEEA